MKTCPYCWRDNVETAVACFDCGKPLPPAAPGATGRRAGTQPLRLGLGVAVFLTAVAVLGWLLFIAEQSRRKSHDRLRAELENRVAQHDEDAANAERKLEKLQAKHDTLWNDFFRLEAQNKELQAQNQKYAEQVRALEKNVARLEGMLQERQAAPVAVVTPKRSATTEGPLPTDVRLASGAVVQALAGLGQGELKVDNWLASDVIIKLVRPYDSWCVAAFYLRAKENYTLTGIPDGSYALYYATGYDYDPVTKDFKRDRATKKSDAALDFSTRDSGLFLSRTRLNFILGTPLGNVGATPVSGAEFDRYRVKP